MANENVNHPAHYNQGKIEVIEFLEDKFMAEPHLWNAVKYLSRAGKKDPAKFVEDCKKAIWYIERRIELHTQEKPRRPNEMNSPVTLDAATIQIVGLTESGPFPKREADCKHPPHAIEFKTVRSGDDPRSTWCVDCGKTFL